MTDPFSAWLRTASAMNALTRTALQAVETIAASHDMAIAHAARPGDTAAAARAGLARMVPGKVAACSEAGRLVAREWVSLQHACLDETNRLGWAMLDQMLPAEAASRSSRVVVRRRTMAQRDAWRLEADRVPMQDDEEGNA